MPPQAPFLVYVWKSLPPGPYKQHCSAIMKVEMSDFACPCRWWESAEVPNDSLKKKNGNRTEIAFIQARKIFKVYPVIIKKDNLKYLQV